jgi:chemotaxis protein MotB
MARRKRQEDHVNHERWLVSYADFITLLFAFFVVMYAVSSVNQGKYRVLSDTLEAAFDPAGAFNEEEKSLNPIQVGETARSPNRSAVEMEKGPSQGEDKQEDALRDLADLQRLNQTMETVETMADELDEVLMPEIQDELVNIKRNNLWLEIEIKSSLLYPSGSATLSRNAVPLIQQIAEVLKPFPNRIHVEGFTDDIPINNPIYPSNWELSSARAASVVRLLAQSGIAPESMAAIGYGEFRPLADNITEEGRSKNRRVVLVVLAAGNYEAVSESNAPDTLRDDLDYRGAGSPILDQAVDKLPLREGP